MTPAQAQDLVDHFGSAHKASQAVGVSYSYIRYRTDPEWAEGKRASVRDHYDALTGVEYNRRLLQMRRACVMHRRRQSIREEDSDG